MYALGMQVASPRVERQKNGARWGGYVKNLTRDRRRFSFHQSCRKNPVAESSNQVYSEQWRFSHSTAVLAKTSHANCRTTLTNRPSRGRRARFVRVVQQSACEVFQRTAVCTWLQEERTIPRRTTRYSVPPRWWRLRMPAGLRHIPLDKQIPHGAGHPPCRDILLELNLDVATCYWTALAPPRAVAGCSRGCVSRGRGLVCDITNC